MSINTAITIGSVLALGLTIYAFIAIIPEQKRESLAPFFKVLHDTFNLRSLLSEKILKALYVFNTFLCETAGFFLLFSRITALWQSTSVWWIGLLLMVLGPFVCRLLHETAMVFILMMKNTNDINRKLNVLFDLADSAKMNAVKESAVPAEGCAADE